MLNIFFGRCFEKKEKQFFFFLENWRHVRNFFTDKIKSFYDVVFVGDNQIFVVLLVVTF